MISYFKIERFYLYLSQEKLSTGKRKESFSVVKDLRGYHRFYKFAEFGLNLLGKRGWR